MFKVISPFFDIQDGNYYYSVGDTYPHGKTVKPSKARIEELSTEKNAIGVVFIEEVPSKKSK